MPEENNLKKEIKVPVENLVHRIFGDIFYRIAKAGVNRAINELKKELKEKSIRSLQRKLETLSERKLEQMLDESTKQLTEKITQQGMEREDLIRQIEQGFRQSYKEKLLTLTKVSVLKIAVITVCLIAAGAGVYAAVDHVPRTRETPMPRDTVPPEVVVRHAPSEPQPGQRITFTAVAVDNVGIGRIELLVNGEVVRTSGSSPCAFEGGPYDEGSTVRYSAYAYDEAGNKAFSGEQFFRIAPPLEPRDNIAPKVAVGHTPPEPQPGQRVTFTVEAEDNVGVELVELWINGALVQKSESSSLVFEGGPYDEGSVVAYSAYAYDKAGNKAFSGEQSLRIPVSVRYPDLVITNCQVTGPLKWEKGVVYAPVHVVVRNQGTATADIFKVTVEHQKAGEPYYLSPFAVPGQASSWYPYTSGLLPAGGEVAFEGDVAIGPESEFVGLTVVLRVTADSCLGDEFQPGYCRVEESHEDNNQYYISVEIPRRIL